MPDGICLYSGLDQLHSIRDALVQCLLSSFAKSRDDSAMKQWFLDQGISADPAGAFAIDHTFSETAGFFLEERIKRSQPPDKKLFEIGAARSGASWKDKGRNFAITSAFVRLLASEEQFEIDVLKALFFYRPTGVLGGEADQIVEEATVDVVYEAPVGKEYTKPRVWTWLREPALDRGERQKIFSRVFTISTLPEGYAPKGKRNQREVWYEKRNEIAHGRKEVVMTLSEYVEVEVFVARSMMFISEQCLERQKVIV